MHQFTAKAQRAQSFPKGARRKGACNRSEHSIRNSKLPNSKFLLFGINSIYLISG
jgi:hypothetical protein